jgi:drug/metabolite transporter (DMT)-like permease
MGLPMNRERGYAVAALVFLSLVWGYNWVLMKEALMYAGPFDFAAWRTGIGAATLFLILLMQGRLRRPSQFRGLAILGLFQIAIFTALTMMALVSGDAGKMSVLVYTMPLWSMVFAWLMLGQKPHRTHLLATAAAFFGILCMAQPWRTGIRSSAVYALGGAAAWGFSSVYSIRLRQTGLDNLSMTAWSMGFGSAILVVVACFMPSPAVRWDSHFAFILFYNAVLAMAVAWLLWTYVLERLSIMAASLSVLAVPLIGSLSSALQLGERFSSIELVGMGTILLSISAVYWKAGKRRDPELGSHNDVNPLRAR